MKARREEEKKKKEIAEAFKEGGLSMHAFNIQWDDFP